LDRLPRQFRSLQTQHLWCQRVHHSQAGCQATYDVGQTYSPNKLGPHKPQIHDLWLLGTNMAKEGVKTPCMPMVGNHTYKDTLPGGLDIELMTHYHSWDPGMPKIRFSSNNTVYTRSQTKILPIQRPCKAMFGSSKNHYLKTKKNVAQRSTMDTLPGGLNVAIMPGYHILRWVWTCSSDNFVRFKKTQ
jgi:hypothetical protein